MSLVSPHPAALPTQTPTPVATRVPTPVPTPTPVLATGDMSYCQRSFGPTSNARFSARLSDIRVQEAEQFFQITFAFTDTDGMLHGQARCAWAAAWPSADLGSSQAPGSAFIGLHLDQWAHDEAFEESIKFQPVDVAPGGPVQGIAFAADSLWSRGALIGIGLSGPRPFEVRLQESTLIVVIARGAAAAYPPSNDWLGQEQGDVAALDRPVFFLQNGDVYRLENGQAQPITSTVDRETALAVSLDGALLAVCRAPQDADPITAANEIRATLWVMRNDGADQRQLADVGGCADPTFDTSGSLIAFTTNVAAVRQVWTVAIIGDEVQPVTAGMDEWNRHAPYWLKDGRLLYRANNDSGQAILVLNDNGVEREISARLLTESPYHGVGRFVVDPVAELIAVEALYPDDAGADLVVLRLDGSQVAVEQRGFWQRPLAFTSDGLVYLTVECPATTVLRYSLRRRTAQGQVETLLSGSTADAIGAVVMLGEMLVYVRMDAPEVSPRGLVITPLPDTPSSVWLLADSGSVRTNVYEAPELIDNLVASPQALTLDS
jgi:hypothetical protein